MLRNRLVPLSALVFALAGCSAFSPPTGVTESIAPVVVRTASGPIVPDGRLTEADWQQAPEYRVTAFERNFSAFPPRTAAALAAAEQPVDVRVRLLRDAQYLYIGAVLVDDDVTAVKPQDQQLHYLYGDVFELFLKPAGESYYWEFYGVPNGAKSGFFFPSRSYREMGPGKLTESPPIPGFRAAAAVDGTLNNWRDTDRGWSVELAIPIAELEKYGAKFDATAPWTILLAGYEFSRYRQRAVNYSHPKLPQLNFHLVEYYAPLRFE